MEGIFQIDAYIGIVVAPANPPDLPSVAPSSRAHRAGEHGVVDPGRIVRNGVASREAERSVVPVRRGKTLSSLRARAHAVIGGAPFRVAQCFEASPIFLNCSSPSGSLLTLGWYLRASLR